MLPIVLGAALLGGIHLWKRRQGNATPARAAVHGWLMNYENRPRELDIAAQVFGAEGLTEQASQLAAKSNDIKQQAAEVPGLVERARLGDQNAMGMIAAVRENAAAGNKRALSSYRLIEQYCICRPVAVEEHVNPDGSSGGGSDPFGWPPAMARPSTPLPNSQGLQV